MGIDVGPKLKAIVAGSTDGNLETTIRVEQLTASNWFANEPHLLLQPQRRAWYGPSWKLRQKDAICRSSRAIKLESPA